MATATAKTRVYFCTVCRKYFFQETKNEDGELICPECGTDWVDVYDVDMAQENYYFPESEETFTRSETEEYYSSDVDKDDYPTLDDYIEYDLLSMGSDVVRIDMAAVRKAYEEECR